MIRVDSPEYFFILFPSAFNFFTECPLRIATAHPIKNTVPAGFSDLGFSDHFGFRNSGFLDDQYINSTLGLATYIGFSDLNRVDEN